MIRGSLADTVHRVLYGKHMSTVVAEMLADSMAEAEAEVQAVRLVVVYWVGASMVEE